jgi:hypothetical protein
MSKTTDARRIEVAGEAGAGEPDGPHELPDAAQAGAARVDPPLGSPLPAGPVTIQVSPQGQVTISVVPTPQVALPRDVGLEAATARGFGEWLRGEEVPSGDQLAAQAGRPGPVEEALDKLRAALKTLGEKIEQFADDVGSLEVRTYVSDRLDQIDDDSQFFTTAEPRALTRIELDGDTKVVVPLSAGQLDEALWKVHVETVAQAQAHREAMFRTVMELVRGLVPTIK